MKENKDFISGVLQIGLGIAVGGVVLGVVGHIYFRYQIDWGFDALRRVELPVIPTSRFEANRAAPIVTAPKPVSSVRVDALTARCRELGISIDQCERVLELRKVP